MATPVRLTFTPTHFELTPGQEATVAVSIRNTSDVVEHYVVGIIGLPHGADSRAEPEVSKLRPREDADVTATVAVSAQQPPPAGTYTVAVLARSLYRPDVSRAEQLRLVVRPVEQLELTVQPQVVHAKHKAGYDVRVTNRGNVGVGIRFRATDNEDLVAWSFQPDGLQLRPGATETARLTAQAPQPWSKEKQRTITIDVLGAAVAAPAQVTFVQPPRFASRLLRLTGLASAVAAVAAAIVAAAVINRGGKGPSSTHSSSGRSSSPASSSSSSSSPSSSSASSSPTTPASSSALSSSTSATPPPPTARTVDLTAPSSPPPSGILPANAFAAQGILLAGTPDTTTAASCASATAVTLNGTATTGRYVTAALPTDPTQCHDVPLKISFTPKPARSVAITLSGPGTERMVVGFHDGSQVQATGLSATDAAGHGAIDSVLLSVPSGTAVTYGVSKVRFAPVG